jgi:hypothetical protein
MCSICLNDLHNLSKGKPVADAPCPNCGPGRKSPLNRVRKVLRIWTDRDSGFVTYHCERCGISGYAFDDTERATVSAQRRRPIEPERDKSEVARWLWAQAKPARGTPIQRYLESRCCWVDTDTIRYLPGRGEHGHAMVAAFGVPSEPEPGRIKIDDARVTAVDLTRINSAGTGKAGTGRDRIMIGPSKGLPIVIAPANDLLGIVIGEGIEKVAAYHIATGLGAWAAGSASRMAALADIIPAYVEHVDILADDDDEAGDKGANELAAGLLRRWTHHRIVGRSRFGRAA